MQKSSIEAPPDRRSVRSEPSSRGSTSRAGGIQGQLDGVEEAKKPACPVVAPPLVTAARGSTCVQCRAAKVRCDKALPSCSRCVRRGERCERREVLGSVKGPAPATGASISILRQSVRDTASFFQQYAGLWAVAVKRLTDAGGVDRVRSVNTLRLWEQGNEACGGFDTTWGLLSSVMECLGITQEDLKATPQPDHPSLRGLIRKVQGAEDLTPDYQAALGRQGVDVGLPLCVCGLEGRRAIWMSEAASHILHDLGEINATVDSEKCLLLFLFSIYCAPSDQEELVDAYVRHLFGRKLSTTTLIMMLSKEGRAALRLLRMRHTAFPEFQSSSTVLTFEEMPVSRHMTRLSRTRDSIIEHFRTSIPEEGTEEGTEATTAGMTTSPCASSSSLPSRSMSTSSISASGGGRSEDGPPDVLPMTSLGQIFDHTRLWSLLQAERAKPTVLTQMLEPPSHLASAMTVMEGLGQGGSAEWPPWASGDQESEMMLVDEDRQEAVKVEGGEEGGAAWLLPGAGGGN